MLLLCEMYSGIFISFKKTAALTQYIKFWDPLISNPQFLLTPLSEETGLNEVDGL